MLGTKYLYTRTDLFMPYKVVTVSKVPGLEAGGSVHASPDQADGPLGVNSRWSPGCEQQQDWPVDFAFPVRDPGPVKSCIFYTSASLFRSVSKQEEGTESW